MTDAPPPAPPAPQPPEAYRDHDISLRGVLGFGAALALIIAVSLAALGWWFGSLRRHQDIEKRSQFPLSAPERADLPQTTFGSPASGQLPKGARLEGLNLAGPQHDVGRERSAGTAAEMYAEDETILNGHGKPGAPRIPIEQAMRLVAEERKPQGREPGPVRYDAGIPGTGGGSNSGRDLPEARR
jgi:hypothetical protein